MIHRYLFQEIVPIKNQIVLLNSSITYHRLEGDTFLSYPVPGECNNLKLFQVFQDLFTFLPFLIQPTSGSYEIGRTCGEFPTQLSKKAKGLVNRRGNPVRIIGICKAWLYYEDSVWLLPNLTSYCIGKESALILKSHKSPWK